MCLCHCLRFGSLSWTFSAFIHDGFFLQEYFVYIWYFLSLLILRGQTYITPRGKLGEAVFGASSPLIDEIELSLPLAISYCHASSSPFIWSVGLFVVVLLWVPGMHHKGKLSISQAKFHPPEDYFLPPNGFFLPLKESIPLDGDS